MATKPAIRLKLNGKPFNPILVPPGIQKILHFLDKSSPEEIFSAKQLLIDLNLNPGYCRENARLIPEQYSQIVHGTRYFGNPKAIAELRRQVGII